MSLSRPAKDGWNWQKELWGFEARLNAVNEDVQALSSGDEWLRRRNSRVDQAFKNILNGVCKVVGRAQTQDHPDLQAIIVEADELINRGLNVAYTGKVGPMIGVVSSFAHMREAYDDGFFSYYDDDDDEDDEELDDEEGEYSDEESAPMCYLAFDGTIRESWTKSGQPHPHSTLMSRFFPSKRFPPRWQDTRPTANFIWQACCEVSSHHICPPIAVRVSSDGSVAAVLSDSGYGHETVLAWWYDEPDWGGWAGHDTRPPVFSLASTLEFDGPRELMFVGDAYTIKTFSWVGGRSRVTPRHVHTLESRRYEGALTLLPGGRLLRAGKGGALSWNIDEVAPRDPKVKEINYNAVEFSSDSEWEAFQRRPLGAEAHATVPFADKDFTPGAWHWHQPTERMLCGEEEHFGYRCMSLDLEHGGTVTARYLGHGSHVTEISSSDGDPNVFLTACADGYARLYDFRTPLPVLTFDVEHSEAHCPTAALVHIDGLAGVFTGGRLTESIKFWDVRMKKSVYELSTGNNSVQALTWDRTNHVLYAATVCSYQDMEANYYGYRKAIRTKGQGDVLDGINGPDVPLWPEEAAHKELDFGYIYDVGGPSLLRYSFKSNADQSVIPHYGDAYIRGLEPSDEEWD